MPTHGAEGATLKKALPNKFGPLPVLPGLTGHLFDAFVFSFLHKSTIYSTFASCN